MRTTLRIVLLLCGIAVFACAKKKAGDSGSASGPHETPDGSKNLPPAGPAGALTLQIGPAEFDPIGDGTYQISNSVDLPATANTYAKGLPAGLTTGSLVIGSGLGLTGSAFGLNSSSPTCTPRPPHANLRDPSLTGALRSTVLGFCRAFPPPSSTVSDATCNALIDGATNQWLDSSAVTHTYQVGLWDRFYDGCGPTDIYGTLDNLDKTVISDVENKIASGRFRCVDIPGLAKNFSATVPNASFSDALGVHNYPFSCASNMGSSYRAYGKDAENFYYWDTAENGSVVKLSLDGNSIDVLRSVGNVTNANLATTVSSGTMGTMRIKSQKTGSDRSVYMTVMGNGMGPDCGAYIASKKIGSVGFIYMEFRNAAPGAPLASTDPWSAWATRCSDVAAVTTTACFKDDFATESDMTQCTGGAMDLDTPPAGFKKFAYDAVPSGATTSFVSPHALANFIRNPQNANGLSFADLRSTDSIEDPLKVLSDRMFGTSVATDLNVAEMISEANRQVESFVSSVTDNDPRCAYEIPKTFVHQSEPRFDPAPTLQLSCQTRPGSAAGVVGDAVHVWSSSDSENQRLAVIAETNRLSLFRYAAAASDPGATWTGPGQDRQAGYFRLLTDNTVSTEPFQEVVLFGDGERFREMGCGVQFQRRSDLFYVRGKFGDVSCSTVIEDRDCLRLESNGKFKREPLSTCLGDGVTGDPFVSPTFYRENTTPSDVFSLASQQHGLQLTSIEVRRDASAALPTAEIASGVATAARAPALTLTSVAAIPPTSASKGFSKISTTPSSLGINCLHAGVGTHRRAVSGTFSYALSALTTAELGKVTGDLASGSAFVSLDVDRTESQVVGTIAVPSVSVALAIRVQEGGSVVREWSGDDPAQGLYILSGFEGLSLGAGTTVEVSWTGDLEVSCPSAANSQAIAGFKLNSAPRLRFNK